MKRGPIVGYRTSIIFHVIRGNETTDQICRVSQALDVPNNLGDPKLRRRATLLYNTKAVSESHISSTSHILNVKLPKHT
jgi:hypothetical protein